MTEQTRQFLTSLKRILDKRREEYFFLCAKSKQVALLESCFEEARQLNSELPMGNNLYAVFKYFSNSGIDQVIEIVSRTLEQQTADIEVDEFDQKFGTLTEFHLEQYELPEQVSAERVLNYSRYDPSPTNMIWQIINKLPEYGLEYSQFSFVDVGSGLGRVLMVASLFPFKNVIGIEISEHLSNVSRANIEKFSLTERGLTPIEVRLIDAMDFDFNLGDAVYYFWEPFRNDEVGEELVAKLLQAYRNSCWVCYLVFIMGVIPAVEKNGYFKTIDKYVSEDMIGTQRCMITIYKMTA